MSLLMDALKRAEASKQAAAREQSAPPGGQGLSLEPLAAAPGAQLPDLATHLASVDAELAAGDTPAPPPPAAAPPPSPHPAPPAADIDAARAAARNAFAAKQAEAAPSRTGLWLALGSLGIAALGIGGYVWHQVSALSPGAPPPASARPPATAQPGATPLPPAAAPPPASAAPATVFAPPATSTATAAAPATVEPQRRTAPAEPAEARVPVRLTRTPPEPEGAVQAAWAKLQAGHLDAARSDYERSLRNDPNNVDALLGLAAIAQREGRQADAERYQQRALVADPRDPSAQAAALAGATAGDALANESRLKSALAAQPESGPLNFALGNLYARQARWPEAQQAFFDAVAADPDNPDYLFNLAVALDHLRQPKLAAQHYRLAEEAAQRRPAAFDRERLRARLGALQP